MDTYVAKVYELKKYPTREDMLKEGFSRDCIRAQFGSLENLKAIAKGKHPEIAITVTEERIKNPKKQKKIKAELKKYKRFVITTIVDNAPAHIDFLRSIRTYCEKNKALLLVVPAGKSTTNIDPLFADDYWIFEDTNLNNNLSICSIKISPKAAQPINALGRIGQREGSIIVGSPKQFLDFVPVGNQKMPHAVMSTGAATVPFYYSSDGEVNRTDYIANEDHVCGAIIVEIGNSEEFHFYQIQADADGKFYDRGYEYKGKKVKKVAPLATVIGDYHVTETDPTAAKAWDEAQKVTGSRVRIHHDFFGGVSINHHEQDNQIIRARLMEQNKLSLEAELRECARVLDEETEKCDLVVIVDSNHHDFLSEHYLPKGMYSRDPFNLKLAAKLVAAQCEGHNPLRYALEVLIGLKHPKKVRWLSMDEDFKVAGVQCGAHGHKGANGSKGSARTLENAYGNSVSGHAHTSKIVRNFWQVGTSSHLRLPYNKGASSWVQSICDIYPNGSKQLIHSINGKWRA